MCRVLCCACVYVSSDARAKVRQLALLIVADTQPPTNLRLLNHVAELTGKEDDKQKWGKHYPHITAHRQPALHRFVSAL